MNSVQILGNLARDPEVRYTKTGRAVATFTVAATNTYIDSTTNETKEQTAFINCVAWGKLGEAAGNLRKGSRCFVEGRLQTRSYETQDGQKRYVTEVVANFVGQSLDMNTNLSKVGPILIVSVQAAMTKTSRSSVRDSY